MRPTYSIQHRAPTFACIRRWCLGLADTRTVHLGILDHKAQNPDHDHDNHPRLSSLRSSVVLFKPQVLLISRLAKLIKQPEYVHCSSTRTSLSAGQISTETHRDVWCPYRFGYCSERKRTIVFNSTPDRPIASPIPVLFGTQASNYGKITVKGAKFENGKTSSRSLTNSIDVSSTSSWPVVKITSLVLMNDSDTKAIVRSS